MKYTKDEIRAISKIILKDLRKEFYSAESIQDVFFEENEEIFKDNQPATTMACWTIAINSLFQNTDFLIISDETGEPLFYQNFNFIVTEIIKREDGTYEYKD